MRINPVHSNPPLEAVFVGRREELGILQRELVGPAPKTVWLSGQAGMGKTALSMMFAESQRQAFPGGVFNLHASPFETLDKSVGRHVDQKSLPFLLILNDADNRPRERVVQELAAVRRSHPHARVLVTARSAPNGGGPDLQLNLGPLNESEFHQLLRMHLASSGSAKLANELFAGLVQDSLLGDSLMGHPLGASLLTDLLRSGQLTPRMLLEKLRSFTWPGLVGPRGEVILDQAPEQSHVLSDVVAVSEEFLRKLHRNPRLLYELTPRGFEELVAELLTWLDYEVTLTRVSKDGGKDIYAAKKDHLGTFLYVVECKRYAPDRPVGVGLVRQLNGVVQAEQATAGILATTSFFTKGAKEFQEVISYQLSLKDYVGIQGWLEAVLRPPAAEQAVAADGVAAGKSDRIETPPRRRPPPLNGKAL